MSDKALTPMFRVSYPNIFKPKKNELSGKEEYSLVAVFAPGTDLTVLKKLAQAALVDKWGPDKAKWPTTLKSPFRKCEERKLRDGTMPEGYPEGGIFVSMKSAQRPGLVDSEVRDIIEPREFYAGCYARATVTAFAYDFSGNRGVSLWMQNVQKMKDGEPIAGRAKAQDDFDPVPGAGAATASGSVFDDE